MELRGSMLRRMSILLVVTSIATAQNPGAPQEPSKDPQALLRAARDACVSLRNASYRGRYEEFGERHASGVTEAEVLVARADAELGLEPQFLVRGTRYYRERTAPEVLHAGFDGKVSRRLQENARVVIERRFEHLAPGQTAWAHAAGDLGAGGNGVVMWSFVSANPLRRHLQNERAEYEGRATVAGTLCHVIYLPGKEPHDCYRLFIGEEDHLPRKIEHIGVMYTDRITGSLLTIWDLRTDRALGEESFRVPVGDGYELRQFEPRQEKETLLAVGEPAPHWTLLDAEGEEHSLRDLRGEVVVLDFWGTWCGPCVRKLPELQELHEALRDRPVTVLGVSCHEPPNGRPRELMRRRGCEFGLLLNGEAICQAYGVTTFPTVYVIGVDGAVLYRSVGGAPPGELKALIEQHLER